MKKINIPWARPFIQKDEKTFLVDAIESTWISGGKYVDMLEEKFTLLHKKKFGITVSSGTASLYMALLALGIGPGDEVIVPGFCFAGACNMILASGASPVFAEIDPDTWCMSAESAKRCITKKTKAVIAVHTYGNVCDMYAIKSIAEDNSLYLIEDTAEAVFSKYRGKYAGTFGDIGCFSFQATKTITTGEGGFLLTDSRGLYEKISLIRNHGMRKNKHYWHDIVGHNFRLTNLQAAMGCAQLEKLDKIISKRRRMYNLYCSHLQHEDGIKMQHFKDDVEPVVWSVAIKIDPEFFKGNRDYVARSMLKSGIETRPGFYPFSDMSIYKAPLLNVSRHTSRNIICLPIFCELKDAQISYICDKLKAVKKKQ